MRTISITRFRTPNVETESILSLLGEPEVTFVIKERGGCLFFFRFDKRNGATKLFKNKDEFNKALESAEAEFYQLPA